MKYASTQIIGSDEVVAVVLPLEMVPLFDPAEPPQSNTYGVPDDVEIGWVKNAQGVFEPPILTLEAAKAAKNTEINTARADANSQVFPYDGHNFACDAMSRSDIDGINGYVALNGDFPALFPGVWKTVANSYYPLPDIEAWKAFYAAMVATGAANFAHAQALKARLAAATTIEEVEAISW